MATFRFGNGRSIARKYAFKFNVKATLFSSTFTLGEDTNTWERFAFSVGAEVKFESLSGDNFRCFTPAITNGQPGENSGPANLFYDAKQVTQDIKDNINSFFTFKQKYYDMQKDLFKLDKYMVLHIRCTDNYFDKDDGNHL